MIPSDRHEPGMSQKVLLGEFPKSSVQVLSVFHAKNEGSPCQEKESAQRQFPPRGLLLLCAILPRQPSEQYINAESVSLISPYPGNEICFSGRDLALLLRGCL